MKIQTISRTTIDAQRSIAEVVVSTVRIQDGHTVTFQTAISVGDDVTDPVVSSTRHGADSEDEFACDWASGRRDPLANRSKQWARRVRDLGGEGARVADRATEFGERSVRPVRAVSA